MLVTTAFCARTLRAHELAPESSALIEHTFASQTGLPQGAHLGQFAHGRPHVPRPHCNCILPRWPIAMLPAVMLAERALPSWQRARCPQQSTLPRATRQHGGKYTVVVPSWTPGTT
eukprot:5730204-Amphidinium_carterae.2